MYRCIRTAAARNLAMCGRYSRSRFSQSRRRSLSSTSASSASQKPIIISRRAWEAYKKKNPSPASATPKKPKEESKPWPRNFQIAGYVAAAVGIPYALLWYVSSSKGVRDQLSEYYPDLSDRLRNHFGSPEEDEVSYVDIKDDKIAPHHILPDEWPYKVRLQEEEIERMNDESIPVKISVIEKDDGGQQQPVVTLPARTVPGKTPATSSALSTVAREAKEYMVDSGSKGNLQVAVDFQDVLPQDGGDDNQDHDTIVSDSGELKSLNMSSSAKPTFQQELYSSWYYQPPKPTETNQRMSDVDVEISRLEYEIEKLKADLKDVNCTRSVDDMQRELKEAKSKLRKIVWKRRLRL